MTILGRLGLSLMQGGCLLLLVVVSSAPVFASNLLSNSDFEQFENGSFPPWNKNVSTLSLSATQSADFVHSGSQAALLGSAANSTKYIYQMIPASPSSTYQLSGWAKLLVGEGSAYLRVSECKTLTCATSSEEIKTYDSTKVENPLGNDVSLEFTTATNAAGLKVKLSLDPKSALETALVWDSVQLQIKETAITVPASSSGALDSPAISTPSATSPRLEYLVPATVSADTPFIVSVMVKNAKPNTNYFLKSLGGAASSSAQLRSVSTLNALGSGFLAWNGSWASMPMVNTDASGTATLTLTSRFNSATTTIGDNNYLIRIREGDSEENIDSDSTHVMVVPAVLPLESEDATTEDDGDSDDGQNDPQVTIEVDNKAIIGSPLAVKVRVTGLSGNATYAYKVRVGKTSSSLSKGATLKDDEALTDGSSWSKFPTFTTSDGGIWEGEVKTLLKDGNEPGDYLLRLRVRELTSTKLFDSSLHTVSFSDGGKEESGETATSSGQVLGTVTSKLPLSLITLPPPVPQELLPSHPSAVLAYDTKNYDFGGHLISMGLFMLGSSFLWSVKLLTNAPL